MSLNTCKSCGEKDCRIDAPMVLDHYTVEDSYCGMCGVNWGVYVEAIHVASRHYRKYHTRKKVRIVRTEAR